MARVTRLRVENHEQNAVGISETSPRISWTIEDEETRWRSDTWWRQSGYEIEVRSLNGSNEVFSVKSSQSQYVPWPAQPLKSFGGVYIRVRVTEMGEETSEWSESLYVEAGLLNKDEWKCSLIEPTDPYEAKAPHRPVLFRRNLKLDNAASKARLYITAHGVYEAKINKQRIGDQVLAPGWTSYQHRLVYQTFDVTDQLKKGENELHVEVAEGWHSGRLSWYSRTNVYSDRPGLIAMLRVEHEDGQVNIYGTDQQWCWAYSPTTSASIYDGEDYDVRLALVDAEWLDVSTKSITDNLVGPDGPPIKRIEDLQPREIITSPSGKTIVDMGQNMVGWLRIKVDGPADTIIRLHFTEVLENGESGTRPLRTAKCTDTVTLSGSGSITWEPKFTFHGFRYVEISGWPGSLSLSDITGVVIHTDMTRTGYFACSNPMLNKLHQNVVWGMRGNFVSIPTDCPQRDERLGWTGDINAFADTANYLYDVSGMLTSWLEDVALDQKDIDGVVPVTSPNILPGPFAKTIQAIWGDCAVMLPWSIYQATGDEGILGKQYSSMKLWLKTIPRREDGLWHYPNQSLILGDWLDPAAPPDNPADARTDGVLVSDAFLVHITDLMTRISSVLGQERDLEHHTKESASLRKAFQTHYITPSGLLFSDTQTAYTLAIYFSLFETPQQLATASERLSLLIRLKSRFKIATGFAGTFLLGHACTKADISNVFYRMLLERKNPSWLYPVTMGATTVWERWDSMLPSGAINPGEMTSFNHYALGAVASWMHNTIAGLKPLKPGWKRFRVEPVPGGGLRWAEAKYVSGYGLCSVLWQIKDATLEDGKEGHQEFYIRVRVPPNTTAEVKIPGVEEVQYAGSGVYEWTFPYQEPQEEGKAWPPKAVVIPFLPSDDEVVVDPELPYDEKLCS